MKKIVFFLILSASIWATHREPQFENAQVKVWKTVISPNEPLNFHRHDVTRIVIGLKGGELEKNFESGETAKLVFETGKAYWFEPDPKGELHADINHSNQNIEVMVIEIKNFN